MRKGSVVIILGLLLVILLGITALVIDLSYQDLVSHQLQNGADAAALAGGAHLSDGSESVRSAAVRLAGANSADGAALEVPDEDVVIGVWDRDTRAFTVLSGDD